MVSTIFKPPFEFMETLSQEQQRRFLNDCREIFGGIVGEENIKSTAYHWDEICGHVLVFWEPMTKDGRLCAKDMHNIEFFNTVNRKVPQELRKRGWDIADCKMYDAAEEEEKMSKMTALEKREYLQERNARKIQSGRSSLRFKMEKNKQLDKEIKDKASKLEEVEKNIIFAESEYEILNENNNDLNKEIQGKEEKLSEINTEIESKATELNGVNEKLSQKKYELDKINIKLPNAMKIIKQAEEWKDFINLPKLAFSKERQQIITAENDDNNKEKDGVQR